MWDFYSLLQVKSRMNNLIFTWSVHSSHTLLCFRIPDSIGKDIEKACQSIYPLHDVYVRKVKMLKKPKFECKCSITIKLFT